MYPGTAKSNNTMDARHQEQDEVNREEEPNNVDLTLRLGVGDSRTLPENSQNQDNFEPGFAMMAGEHSNPWPHLRSNSFGSIEEILRMILSVNHYDSMERLLNGDRGVDAEPAADQANAVCIDGKTSP